MSLASALLCLLACLSTIASEDQHLKELREHYEHLKYIAEFKCHAPQPRVLSVHHLFPEKTLHDKAFFPEVTVLHRCDSTGSCTSQHHCQAAHSVTVDLPFKVTFLQDVGDHKRGTWTMEYHALENHTDCACVAPPPPPEPVITDMFCSSLRTSCSSLFTTCSQLHTSCGTLSLAQKYHEKTPADTPQEGTTSLTQKHHEKTDVETPQVVVNETTNASNED